MFRTSEKLGGPRGRRRSRSAALLQALLWAVVVVLLLVAPVPGPKGGYGWFRALEGLGADKLVHLALFAVQALLVDRWLRAAGVRRPGLWAVLVTLAFGALTEALQAPLPDRNADPWDLAADGLGAFLAVWVAGRRQRGE